MTPDCLSDRKLELESTKMDFIVKLGGSAITDKTCFETLCSEKLVTAASTLGKCFGRGLRFVVIHGAGSFGHHHAHEYGVNSGYGDEIVSRKYVMEGFCKTRISVCKLNQHIVETLVDHGVPAVGLSPCGTWSTNQGVLTDDGTAAISQLFQQGFIPCLHGDCVLDQSQGCKILSGDTIIQRLCEVFSPSRVIFLTDVAGLYTKPPEQPGAMLIPKIQVKSDGNICTIVHTSTDHQDVTGGIQLKLNSAAKIVQHSKTLPVIICSDSDGAFETVCLTGKLDGKRGTVVEHVEEENT